MTEKELELREILWLQHKCEGRKIGHLYGDDGEMQCSNCGSDFLRQSLSTLADNMNYPKPSNFFKGK